MDPRDLTSALLATARRDFPMFYLRAEVDETKLMDMLVLVTALLLRLKKKVAGEASGARLEDNLREAERRFVELRDELKARPILNSLPSLERRRIEAVIFARSP